MELYAVMLAVLVAAAVADLHVGVANDAVNFLNSAVGARAAPRHVILVVASCGVLAGTLFSGGMMEVARTGIFNPDRFAFHDVMVIFLAVMLTDIILLDLFNTFGLPTSTTVSLVFELLGGAVAVSIMHQVRSGGALHETLGFINTGNVFTIVSSIGLSIALAFVAGVAVQFASRILFTFDYQNTFRRYGAVWAAVAFTAILYFVILKGARGAAFLGPDQAAWIAAHLPALLGLTALFLFGMFQLFAVLTPDRLLRGIVLTGTFALALSFAANDLVNFIGAPMAALAAYQIASGTSDPTGLTMEGLAGPVRVDILYLAGAGLIMVMTLWLSRKARTVTRTEVSLGRQDAGVERFGSSPAARALVGMWLAGMRAARRLIPGRLRSRASARLAIPAPEAREGQAFDLVRASVNLMVASALISLGTSLKLPLSTTFVTFMVAMSTSLADGAWGRESAVYRVNGVLTVVGGWFVTALLAFVASGLLAAGMYRGGVWSVSGASVLALLAFLHSRSVHRRREQTAARGGASLTAAAVLTGLADGLDRLLVWVRRDDRRMLRDGLDILRNGREECRSLLVVPLQHEPDSVGQCDGISSIAAIQEMAETLGMLCAELRQAQRSRTRVHPGQAAGIADELRETALQLRRSSRIAAGGRPHQHENRGSTPRPSLASLLRIHRGRTGAGRDVSDDQLLSLVRMVSGLEGIRQSARALVAGDSSAGEGSPVLTVAGEGGQ